MKKVAVLVTLGAVCVASAGCGSGGLSDQDEAAIRQVFAEALSISTAQAPDMAAYAALYYAEDATVLVPNLPPFQGRAAIEAMLKAMPPTSDQKFEIVEIGGGGDVAYVRGNYAFTVTPPGGAAVSDRGKYVEIWRKQADGTWKVRYDSWSSDLPVPGVVVPTGQVAADAGAEVKKLADVVGRWEITGTGKTDPSAEAGPVVLSLDCQWFTTGLEVVCAYNGTNAGQPYQELLIERYDDRTRSHTIYSVMNPGGAMSGRLVIEAGKWTHLWDLQIEGRPAKLRLVISTPTPAGGTWTNDVSVAGGPWVLLGEGSYTKAQ